MMEKLLRTFYSAIIFFTCISLYSFSQAPQAISYQAVARDARGNALTGEEVTIRLLLVSDPEASSVYYSESHSINTGPMGVINLNMGDGTVIEGDFETIDWGSTPAYLKVEIDLLDGNGFTDMGTSRLLSVPYALYAASGTEGPQGPEGPPGPQGEAGTGLRGRGGWVNGQTYEPNDFVFAISSNDAGINSMWIVQAGQPFVSTVQPWKDTENWVEFQAPAGEPGMLPDGTAAGNTTFWDGSQWIVSSNNLFNDGNNIGIGTADPSQKLDVNGDIRLRGHIYDSGNLPGGSGQVLGRGDGGVIWQDMPDSGITGSGTAGNIAYWSGVSSLGSLPHILYSDDESVKIASKEDAGDDDPIFEVKNRDGQVVFGVYQTGVRIYVEDDVTKGPRAGFAVGGFTRYKGDEEEIEYLRVDPGRVRITIDDSLEEKDDDTKGPRAGFAVGGFTRSKKEEFDYFSLSASSAEFLLDETGLNKGPRAGFAVGGFTRSKDGVQGYFNISGTETPDIIDSEARILWYPQKEAFLAGRVLVESPDSVGTNSWASGFESKSTGSWSQALGYRAVARGDYSTAIGREAVATSDNSFALGQFARASNDESYAFGRGAVAQGLRSYAFGSFGIDSAGFQTGITHAKGDYSTAIGQRSVSEGFGSVTLGLANTAKGNYSVAVGYKTDARGFGSTAIGRGTQAIGGLSTALGYNTNASGNYSTATGWETESSGESSTAMGYGAIASGSLSIAIGTNILAPSGYETVVGRLNTTYTPASTTEWNPSDRLFVIGNGIINERSNAMTVLKNGHTGFGTDHPAALLHTYGSAAGGGNVLFEGSYKSTNPGDPPASGAGTRMMWYPDRAAFRAGGVGGTDWNKANIGAYSVAMGYNTKANSAYSTAMGWVTEASGLAATAMGNSSTASGDNATAIGYAATASGNFSSAIGVGATASGNSSSAFGSSTTASGTASLATGDGTIAPSGYETALGRYNTIYSPASSTGWSSADRLFVIGRGTSSTNRLDALVVMKSGRIGIGTSTPGATLTVGANLTGSAASHSLRINAGSLGSWSGNTRKLASIGFTSPNQTSLGIEARRTTNGTDWNSTAIGLKFDVDDVSAVNNAQIWLTSAGNVGIGTFSPTHILHITGQGRSTESTWATSSDIRVKENISALKGSLELLMHLNPVQFSYTEEYVFSYPEYKGKYRGFVAQEFNNVFPEMISSTREKIGDEIIHDFLLLNQGELIPLMVRAIQEQQEIIGSQQLVIETLEQKIDMVYVENDRLSVTLNEIDELKSEIELLKSMIMMLSNVD